MLLSVAKRLKLEDMQPTTISLLMVDRSIAYPQGIVKNIFVRIEKLVFPVDFVIFDMPEDRNQPLILGRPFLATGRALIDVQDGELTFRVNGEELKIPIYEALKRANDNDAECFSIQTILGPPKDSLAHCIKNSIYPYMELDKVCDELLEYLSMLEANPPHHHRAVNSLNINRPLEGYAKEEIVEQKPTKMELKPLPDHLKFALLGEDETYPVIVSSYLTEVELEKLLRVLRTDMPAIGWTIEDIKGISPTICMHQILLEENQRSRVQPQRRLNPAVQEVVRKEVLKLLDTGMIYAISDSEWVSPTQVVSKKGGMKVIKDEKNELIATRLDTGRRVCIDYRLLNAATRKDHSLPFVDQMLD